MDEIDSFDKAVQKKLRKIEKNWEKFIDSTLLKAHPPPTTSWKITSPPALKHAEKNKNGLRNTEPCEGLKNFVFRPRKSNIFEGFHPWWDLDNLRAMGKHSCNYS